MGRLKLKQHRTWVNPWGRREVLEGRLDYGLLERLRKLRKINKTLHDLEDEIDALPKKFQCGSEHSLIRGCWLQVEDGIGWMEHWIKIGGKR